jgi:hypothetical protein
MRSKQTNHHPTAMQRWLRFAVALSLFIAFIGVLMSGVTPPGICGEVLRHNQAHEIDASPLFYSDVEHMSTLESGVRTMRRTAADRQANSDAEGRILRESNAQSH